MRKLLYLIAAIAFVGCSDNGGSKDAFESNNGKDESDKQCILTMSKTEAKVGEKLTAKVEYKETDEYGDTTLKTLEYGKDYVVCTEGGVCFAENSFLLTTAGDNVFVVKGAPVITEGSNNGKDEADKECILTVDKVSVGVGSIIVPTVTRKSDNKVLKYGEDYVICSQYLCYPGDIKLTQPGENILHAKNADQTAIIANEVIVQAWTLDPEHAVANKVTVRVK